MKIKKVLVLAPVLLLASCSDPVVPASIIGSVSQNSVSPVQISSYSIYDTNEGQYVYGDDINVDGISVQLYYSNGSTSIVPSEYLNFEFDDWKTFKSGEHILKISSSSFEELGEIEYKYNVIPKTELSVLFIGNSFSQDTAKYMVAIGENLGIDIHVENMYIGGCSLDQHYSNYSRFNAAYDREFYTRNSMSISARSSLDEAVSDEDWDYISLQQASGFSGIASSYSHLGDLLDLIKEDIYDIGKTKFVWNMTWAYQGNSTHGDFAKYNRNQETMYTDIVSAVQSEVLDYEEIATVIPNGTSIQNARTSFIGDNLTRDGFHLTMDFGRYIAALTAIKTLTGADITECDFAPSSLTPRMIDVAFESVNNAVENKFLVTESQFIESDIESFDPSDYDLVNIDWNVRAFYDASNNFPPNPIFNNASLSKNFCCTQIFDIEELPIGTVITIAQGYKYRPDAWINETTKTSVRPDNTSQNYIIITENWYGNFTLFGFNISNTSGATLTENEISLIENGEIFNIYVPKN